MKKDQKFDHFLEVLNEKIYVLKIIDFFKMSS